MAGLAQWAYIIEKEDRESRGDEPTGQESMTWAQSLARVIRSRHSCQSVGQKQPPKSLVWHGST